MLVILFSSYESMFVSVTFLLFYSVINPKPMLSFWHIRFSRNDNAMQFIECIIPFCHCLQSLLDTAIFERSESACTNVFTFKLLFCIRVTAQQPSNIFSVRHFKHAYYWKNVRTKVRRIKNTCKRNYSLVLGFERPFITLALMCTDVTCQRFHLLVCHI